jgi:hypothetical protein
VAASAVDVIAKAAMTPSAAPPNREVFIFILIIGNSFPKARVARIGHLPPGYDEFVTASYSSSTVRVNSKVAIILPQLRRPSSAAVF